jgi:hypothetical protein
MLVMAGFMVAMVGGFYYLIVIPNIHLSMDRLVGRHGYSRRGSYHRRLHLSGWNEGGDLD